MGAALAIQDTPPGSGAYAAPVGVKRIRVGDRPLLFHEGRRELFQLNETAELIWNILAAGRPANEAARALAALGLDPGEARGFVADAARAWMLAGCLVPLEAHARRARRPLACQAVALDELAVELAAFDAWAATALEAVFGHLQGPPLQPPRRLEVVPGEGLFFLFLDGAPLRAVEPGGLAAEVKAVLTDLYANAVRGAFLAHGALLTKGGAAVFLTGQPGAGKTTLTLALAAAGWAYGGDDIVRFDSEGLACAAPFASAVKSGAWSLLAPLWPGLEDLPVWLRADGQQTRYLLPLARAERQPRPLTALLLLDRRHGAAAELQPIEPLEALTTILDSAYAAEGRLEARALEALAARVEAATCRRLVYSDLRGAVSAIEELALEPA